MGDIVQLRSPIDLTSDLGHAFVVDATRAAEGLLTDEYAPVDNLLAQLFLLREEVGNRKKQ